MGCTMLVCLGFITFQVYGYHLYCILDHRPWCQQTIPLLYQFVQKFYWWALFINVMTTYENSTNRIDHRGNGFLAYYELKQIPNFLLASPIIIISCYGIWSYISFDKSRFLTVGMKGDTGETKMSCKPLPCQRIY
jgi:GPI mannosyltransferase 2